MDAWAPHPASALFPIMSDEDLADLARDIAEHGLLSPVTKFEGLILDGRNRLRACELAGVDPVFVEWQSNGETPTEWVISVNLHRRHLTVAQRAAIAVEALPLFEAEAKERQGGSGRFGSHGSTSPDAEPGRPGSAARVARQFGVSSATVQRAKRVQRADPAMFEQMKAGTVRTVADAQRNAGAVSPSTHLTATRRDRPLDTTALRNANIANKARERVVGALAQMVGMTEALATINYGNVRSASSAKDLDMLAGQITTITRGLKAIGARLREDA